MDAVVQQLCSGLRAARLPIPCTAWARSFLSAQKITSPPPKSKLPPLIESARTAILAADLTAPNFLDASLVSGFPPPATFAADVQEASLPADVIVQVLDIEDLTRSRWDQVQELEAVERGEMRKGREIIRAPVDDDEAGGASGGRKKTHASTEGATGRDTATHRLVLQDHTGFQAFALEFSRIRALGVGTTTIGAKLLISAGARVARGMILLEPANCAVLGGGVASWHAKWVEEKKKRLKETVAPVAGRKK
ncbi:hypothetical protein TD95_000271 [Thielaviopsis punctulata]|uniref:RecQ-mediated genome instability protein 1 n=1 Tax=Thielaviopsis punctulata TaxID=72032 RepID=A0A0F4ZFH6_9PEZI|nr:hypothetical protein TD95_000271 [Thielaviopsis punctulata]